MAMQNAENGVVWGWLGDITYYTRSWAMPLFDRAHRPTTSYSTLIETICGYLVPFSAYRGLHRVELCHRVYGHDTIAILWV